jgi:hypothetical protein
MVLWLLLCHLVFAQNQGTHVDGRVTNAVTGEPLRKAEVQLHGGAGGDYGAVTDASGHYAIEQIAPGSYNLTAQHQNFAVQSYGSKRPGMPGAKLTLSAGQQMSSIDIKMTPFGVISGKVVDEDGDPVTGAPITVLKWGFMRGGRQLTQAGGGATTNDRGEFRVYNLAAGRYYLMAMSVRRNAVMASSISTYRSGAPRSGQDAYMNTFYPSAPDVASAAPVLLGDGQEISGRDIQLRKTRTVTVQGKIAGGSESQRVSISLYSADSSMNMSFGMNRVANVLKQDGTFSVTGVAPGNYILVAMLNNRMAARQDVVVSDADLQDVVVNLMEPGTIKGRVLFEGSETNASKLSGLRVSLTPVGMVPMSSPNSSTGADGSFTMEEVSPDRFKVNCSPMEGAYLKTIRWNGQVSNDATVEMAGGGSGTLELVFATTSAEIDGDVKLDDQPAPGASILLVPASGREFDLRYMMADQNGHFAAKGVAPGGYTALAMDTAIYGMPDAALLKALEKFSAYTTVDQNGQATVSLTLISTAEIEAAQ